MPTFSLSAARLDVQKGNFASAVANYMGILKFFPVKAAELHDEFVSCLRRFCSDELTAQGRGSDAAEFWAIAATELYPMSSAIKFAWTESLASQGLWGEATMCYIDALELTPPTLPPFLADDCARNLENLKTNLIDQWHFRMLNDSHRNRSYEQAIRETLQELGAQDGNVSVLDVGAGTGILSVLAVQNGVSSVWACERDPVMSEMCRRVLRANDQPGIRLLNKDSQSLLIPSDLPHPVSLVVTELMDAGFYGEDIIGTLADARCRLLDADVGRIIPASATVFAALVEASAIKSMTSASAQMFPAGISSSSDFLYEMAVGCKTLSEPYTSETLRKLKGGARILSEPAEIDSVAFSDAACLEAHLRGIVRETELRVVDAGEVHAIAVWFQVQLAPGIFLSTAPDANSSWEQAIFPLMPFPCHTGTRHSIRISIQRNWLRCKVLSEEMSENSVVCSSSNSLLFLNDNTLINWFRLSMQSLAMMWPCGDEEKRFDGLDISQHPLVGIMAAKLLHKMYVKVVRWEADRAVWDQLLKDNPDIADRVRLVADVESESEQVQCLLHLPITPSGLFAPNILEDIAYFRLKLQIQFLLPSVIEIWCQLVECPELVSFTRLASDEKTLGVRIRDTVNLFRTAVQEDVELETLDYRAVTRKFRLAELNLLEDLHGESDELPRFVKQNGRVETPASAEAGVVHAALVWYQMWTPGSPTRMDTSDPTTHFKVAAHMLSEQLHFNKGQIFAVSFDLHRSSLSVDVDFIG